MALFFDQTVTAGLLVIGIALSLSVISLRERRANIIIPSPLQAVSRLSADEVAQLPYPPNALPGARDVATPYGDLRIYEWGPEDGRKVLMVHGISTPCVALGTNLYPRGTVHLADGQ